MTGMRRSEISGLKWNAVNLDEKTLKVERTLLRITGKGLVEGIPKTTKSLRTIDLGEGSVRLLSKIRLSQAKARLTAGPVWRDFGYVFARDDGNPIDPDDVTHSFTNLVRKNSLPHLTFHGLRHAHATLLLASGIQMKVISERLGHSNISITMDTYAHVMPNMQREAAEAIEGILAKASGL